jgi:hypothetical protein
MDQTVTGTIHGNTIVLDATPAVADGQAVEVVIRPMPTRNNWGEGIVNSAGGWAAYPEMDAIMDNIHAQRKLERRDSSSP